MTAAERQAGPREAGQHLRKANEFLATALEELEAKRYSAAVSCAVVAGINAADVICIGGRGARSASKEHDAALALLRQAGPLGLDAVSHLGALLPLKNVAQYSAVGMRKDDADTALGHAEELVVLARSAAADIPGL